MSELKKDCGVEPSEGIIIVSGFIYQVIGHYIKVYQISHLQARASTFVTKRAPFDVCLSR